jgi:predicted NUDIX family phosphoesterase
MRGLSSVHRLIGDKFMAAWTEENAKIAEGDPKNMEKIGLVEGVDFVNAVSNVHVSTRDRSYN